MTRVGIYIRVSTRDQCTDSQREELIRYAASRGWEEPSLYVDEGTGTNDRRPALQSLLKDARRRKLDVICCWKFDRLFRSLRHLVETLNELDELGVAFVAVRDQIDLSTSSGRLMMHIVGAFAEFEASLCRERVRAGLEAARQRGVKLGRRRHVDREQVVRLRAAGWSYRRIARELSISQGAVADALRDTVRKTPRGEP